LSKTFYLLNDLKSQASVCEPPGVEMRNKNNKTRKEKISYTIRYISANYLNKMNKFIIRVIMTITKITTKENQKMKKFKFKVTTTL